MMFYRLYDVLTNTAIAKDSDLAWPSHVNIMWACVPVDQVGIWCVTAIMIRC